MQKKNKLFLATGHTLTSMQELSLDRDWVGGFSEIVEPKVMPQIEAWMTFKEIEVIAKQLVAEAMATGCNFITAKGDDCLVACIFGEAIGRLTFIQPLEIEEEARQFRVWDYSRPK